MCSLTKKKAPSQKSREHVQIGPDIGPDWPVMTKIYFAKIDAKRWIITKETKNERCISIHRPSFENFYQK